MGVGIRDLLRDNIHHGGEEYLPLIGTIGIFILFCNLINVIPGIRCSYRDRDSSSGMRRDRIRLLQLCGHRRSRAIGGHGKHFLGPIPAMAPLMLPIELFSHSFRLLSLTVRLWVNMLVSEMLYVIFLGMMLSIYVALAKMGTVGHAAAIFPLMIPLAFYTSSPCSSDFAGVCFHDSSDHLCGGRGRRALGKYEI